MNNHLDSSVSVSPPADAASCWPSEISIEAFRRAWALEGVPVWETVFEMHREKMQIKNVNVAISNLENIFTTTFNLTAEKGFQAMSLRDLSRETGISMGGLYSYIGSKNELASVIEDVLRHYIHKVLGSLEIHDLDPVHQAPDLTKMPPGEFRPLLPAVNRRDPCPSLRPGRFCF